MTELLEIHPDFFEEMGHRVACDLILFGIIPADDEEKLLKVQELVRKRLSFQKSVHDGWGESDEESAVRVLMNRRDSLKEDQSGS